MKYFLFQKQQPSGIFLKNNNISVIIRLIISLLTLLLSMPLYAGSSYLFPSDIIDQSEQSQYELGRADRYASQREWVYPQATQKSAFRSFKGKPVYPDANQYQMFDGQPESARNQFQQYQPKDNLTQGYSSQRYSSQSYPSQSYPSQGYPSQAETLYPSEQARSPAYFSKNLQYPEGNYVRSYGRSYPGLLYPSDMEVKNIPIMTNSYRTNSFGSNSFPVNSFSSKKAYNKQIVQEKQNPRIQYVPVPVYSVPGTLPGTIPGVVTPRTMVPGYSHLSPGYEYGALQSGLPKQKWLNRKGLHKSGLSPFMGTQYNPLTGLGVFSGSSIPVDTFYKTYGNNLQNMKPFGASDSMLPGFSMPDMFSSQ